MTKNEKLILLSRSFKKAHVYKDLEEAKQGLHGSPERIERFARNRLRAQEAAKLIKKERGF